MQALLKKYEESRPAIVFEWHDSETEAEGWLVINSLRGGAAGGGTRMRKGLDRHEVESLAKTMEIKFTVSGPAMGGAKSGINFDPADPRKEEVLKRWFQAVSPLLKAYYGTGGDLNVDEVHEVIPITESFGVWHPQEGVVNGVLAPREPQKIQHLGRLRTGVSKIVEDPEFTPALAKRLTIADLITGYGVAASIVHYYELWGGDVKGKRALIQGWGNVGAAAGYYLAKAGVKVVGILDRAGAFVNNKGFSLEEISHFAANRRAVWQEKEAELIPFEEAKELFWSTGGEIFVPAAGSRMLTKEQLQAMALHGLEVISSGANVPFADKEIFYGDTLAYADRQFAVIPDFIANCGMARVFAFLMDMKNEISDQAIFEDTSNTIFKALQKVQKLAPQGRGITENALRIALEQLVYDQQNERVSTGVY